MSLPPTPTEPQANPGQRALPGRSLLATVAEAIARAQTERRFGCYDYSRYPGDAPPHVIRDEIDRRELFRGWDHDECQRRFVEIKRLYLAEAALGAVVEFYRG